MIQTTEQTLSKRLLGLPAVARLALFARAEGPAVLITTAERLNLYRDTGLFGTPSSLNPNLSDWQDKHDKVVLDLKTAVSSFPEQPEAYALTLEVGREYARNDLLTQLVSFGYERDGMPGVVVRGDTLSVYLDEEDEEKVLRLEFFGDELDTMQRSGQTIKRYTLFTLRKRRDRRERMDLDPVRTAARYALSGLI